MRHFQSELNFTYTLITPPDGKYGGLEPDNTWNGMVRQIQDGAIDVVVCDLTVTTERSQAVTFSVSPETVFNRFFIPNPTGSYNYGVYSAPLHWRSWIGIFVFILVIPPFLYVIVKYGSKDETGHELRLIKSYVFTAGAMPFARGWDPEPSTARGKLAFVSILLGGTLVFWHWEAMLISYLTSRTIFLPFDSLESMMATTDTKIIVVPGSATADEFRYSRDPLWQKAWSERIEPKCDTYPFYMRDQFSMLMHQQGFAVYTAYTSGITMEEYVNCSVIDIPADYNYKGLAFAFQINSPYLGPFNHILDQMRERGTVTKIKAKYAAKPQVCPDFSGKALGFDSCCTAFILLSGGLSLAFLAFLLEFCFRRFDLIKKADWCTYEKKPLDQTSDEYLWSYISQLQAEIKLLRQVNKN